MMRKRTLKEKFLDFNTEVMVQLGQESTEKLKQLRQISEEKNRLHLMEEIQDRIQKRNIENRKRNDSSLDLILEDKKWKSFKKFERPHLY